MLKRKNWRIRLLSKCALYVTKSVKFIKEQEASGLWRNLAIKMPVSKIHLVGSRLF